MGQLCSLDGRSIAFLAISLVGWKASAQTVACSSTIFSDYCAVSLADPLYVHACPKKLTICLESIQSALKDAATYFSHERDPGMTHLGMSYLISIPAGTYDFSRQTVLGPSTGARGVFDLSRIQVPDASPPAAQEVLVISGAGSANTNIITSHLLNTFFLNSKSVPLSHFLIANAHFGRDNYAATQGVVSAVQSGQITVDISAGFNGPDFGYDPTSNQRAMRLYDNRNPANPRLVTAASNGQVYWAGYARVSSLRASAEKGCSPGHLAQAASGPKGGAKCKTSWNITLNDPSFDPGVAGYQVGSFVCLKNQGASGNFANFNEVSSGGYATDVTFTDLKLTEAGRMKFSGLHNVTVRDVSVQRRAPNAAGQAPCLSTDSGGVQLGNSNSGIPTFGNVVSGFTAQAMGDDTIAFFNDQGGTHSLPPSIVSASTIADGFARFVLINTLGTRTVDSWAGNISGDNSFLDCPAMQEGKGFGVNFTCPIYFTDSDASTRASGEGSRRVDVGKPG